MSNIKDITFKIENNKFNYRACAIIINDNKILALKDEVYLEAMYSEFDAHDGFQDLYLELAKK